MVTQRCYHVFRRINMTTITFKLSEKEKKIFQDFAKFNGTTLSQFIKSSAIEKIEDEYDYLVGEKAYLEFINSGEEARDFSELLDEYGI